ncbi:MAG: tetraacyldisaccharide 4'-kinase [Rhodospirillaceae bacterium]
MRAPEFWQTGGPLARILEPFGLLYGAVTVWRLRHGRPVQVPVPVVCVGNVVAGGVGKTPVVLDLLRRLSGAHALLRGYGGKERGPLRVDPARHDYEAVGDEALLLADRAPTWVARNRAAGARCAADAGASVIVMDDGFQNPSIAKDLSLVVIDGVAGFGNRRIIPAGPLREPLHGAFARADAVVLMGPDESGVVRRLERLGYGHLPVLRASLVPGPEAVRMAGRKVVAFAGIGRPGKFFTSLRELGAQVLATHPFADHYPYAPADIQPILDEAFQLGATPVTTAKDAVRLPLDQRQQVDVLGVAVAWQDEAALNAVLARVRNRLTAPEAAGNG